MNEYKKISIVNEWNEETKKWEIKNIVIFGNNNPPIIVEYTDYRDLTSVCKFMMENGLDIMKDGLKNAMGNGLVSLISSANEKEMEELQSEILNEQITYNHQTVPEQKLEEDIQENVAEQEKDNLERAKKLAPKTKEIGTPSEERIESDQQVNTTGSSEAVSRAESTNPTTVAAQNDIPEEMRIPVEEDLIPPLEEKIESDQQVNTTGSSEAVSRAESTNPTTVAAQNDISEEMRIPAEEDLIPPSEERIESNYSDSDRIERELENSGVVSPKRRRYNPDQNSTGSSEVVSRDESTNPTTAVAQNNIPEGMRIPAEENLLPPSEEKMGSNYDDSDRIERELENSGVVSPKRRRYNPDQNSTGYSLNRNEGNLQTKGTINPKTDSVETIDVDGTQIKVKKTSKWKKFAVSIATGLLAIGIGIATGLGISKLFNRNKKSNVITPTPTISHMQTVKPTAKPTPTVAQTLVPTAEPTSTVAQTPVPTAEPTSTVAQTTTPLNITSVIADYLNNMEASISVRNFISQNETMNFLSQYKNEAQLKEVLSALAFGYEANILTTKDGNFRLDADGNNYLRSFTENFLCAKVMFNDYSPEQMLAVFGDADITFSKLNDKSNEFLKFLTVYGMNAKEPLPLKYLTNNDAVATEILEDLFNKLIVVNQNRKNETLTSDHTDAFIAKVYDIFVYDNIALQLTSGTKTIAAAMVDSFTLMQAEVAYGEALYLHKDTGHAKAGDNLHQIDGYFTYTTADKTEYHISNLYEMVNHDFVESEITNYEECMITRQLIDDNLQEMHRLSRNTVDNVKNSFATLLYQNGLQEYATTVLKGNITNELLDKIERANPSLAEEVDTFEQQLRTATSEYVPFKTTTDGVDELLGIKGLKNEVVDLVNNRREDAFTQNYDITFGHAYVSNYGNGYGGKGSGRKSKTTVTVTREEVKIEDMTEEERKQAEEQQKKLQEEQEKENSSQKENAEKVAQEVVDAVQSGQMTGEEAEKKLEDAGIKPEEDVIDKIKDLVDESEKKPEEDRKNQELSEQEREEAEKRNEQIQVQENEQVDQYNSLIEQGTGLENSSSSQEPISPDTDYASQELIVVQQESNSEPEVAPVVQQESSSEPQVAPVVQQESSSEPEVAPVVQQESSSEPQVAPVVQQESSSEPEVAPVVQQEPISLDIDYASQNLIVVQEQSNSEPEVVTVVQQESNSEPEVASVVQQESDSESVEEISAPEESPRASYKNALETARAMLVDELGIDPANINNEKTNGPRLG